MSQETQTVLQHPEFHGRIGVARREITPPVGIYARLWGSATHDVAEGIHRPLTLTAMALQENPGGQPLVLIAANGVRLTFAAAAILTMPDLHHGFESLDHANQYESEKEP